MNSNAQGSATAARADLDESCVLVKTALKG